MPNHEAKMRVHERGSGETKSCGTGTCAVALAATMQLKEKLPARWVIYTPGGRLVVDIDPHSNATLTGPALLISDHDLTPFFAGCMTEENPRDNDLFEALLRESARVAADFDADESDFEVFIAARSSRSSCLAPC
jgi:hypothetical protein